MRWLELCAPPGAGKSTIADPLWGPRAVQWDGKPHPAEWGRFLAVVERLLGRIRHHPSYRTCESMVHRSLRKMATVSRMPRRQIALDENGYISTDAYIQTGFAQRGLGIGWRLGTDVEAVAEYFEAMPISLGVAFLVGPVEEIQRRNVARGKDRAWMVPLVQRPMQIGAQVLRARGVPVIEVDATASPDRNRTRLVEFAAAA